VDAGIGALFDLDVRLPHDPAPLIRFSFDVVGE
jgi:hypothetical protein